MTRKLRKRTGKSVSLSHICIAKIETLKEPTEDFSGCLERIVMEHGKKPKSRSKKRKKQEVSSLDDDVIAKLAERFSERDESLAVVLNTLIERVNEVVTQVKESDKHVRIELTKVTEVLREYTTRFKEFIPFIDGKISTLLTIVKAK